MTDQDPIERLRAADPARDVEVSADFAARIMRRRDEGDTAELPATAPDGGTDSGALPESTDHPAPTQPSAQVTDLDSERVRRRRPWLAPVAASAAAALIFGMGGYALGTTVQGGASDAAPAAASTEAESASEEMDAQADAAEDSEAGSESLVDAPDPAATGSLPSGCPAGVSCGADSAEIPYVYSGAGLSEEREVGTAYGMDTEAALAPESLQRLAAALGMSGEFEESDDSLWLAGEGIPLDGGVEIPADSLMVFSSGKFAYSQSAEFDPGEAECLGLILELDQNATREEQAAAERSYADCVDGSASEMVSDDEAEQRLRALISDLGMDPELFAYQASDYADGGGEVTGTLWLDGMPTTVIFHLQASVDGIIAASGTLAQPVSLGEYPLVSEAEAVERLNDARFGVSIVEWGIGNSDGSQSNDSTGPVSLEQGEEIEWPIVEVTVTSRGRAYGSENDYDGINYILPTYRFATSEGYVVQVVAVADEYLDFSGQ